MTLESLRRAAPTTIDQRPTSRRRNRGGAPCPVAIFPPNPDDPFAGATALPIFPSSAMQQSAQRTLFALLR